MTDLELFKRTTPEEELVALAFSRWQENTRIPTHAKGCHAWGMNHYECAKLRITELEALSANLKQEAQIHAMEARTANATINEIYRLITGATGEPANFTSKSDHKGGRNPRIIRWWYGKSWSTAAFPDFTATEAADSAFFKALKQDCIQWTDRWWL